MSAIADAYVVACERAFAELPADEREVIVDRCLCDDLTPEEWFLVQAEFEKVTRADIGRPPLPEVRLLAREWLRLNREIPVAAHVLRARGMVLMHKLEQKSVRMDEIENLIGMEAIEAEQVATVAARKAKGA